MTYICSEAFDKQSTFRAYDLPLIIFCFSMLSHRKTKILTLLYLSSIWYNCSSYFTIILCYQAGLIFWYFTRMLNCVQLPSFNKLSNNRHCVTNKNYVIHKRGIANVSMKISRFFSRFRKKPHPKLIRKKPTERNTQLKKAREINPTWLSKRSIK